MKLTQEEIQFFESHGYLLKNNFYPPSLINNIQRKIYDLIGEFLSEKLINDDRTDFDGSNFDQKYNEIISINRAWGGVIYDAVKQIPAFLELVSSPSNSFLFKSLRPHSFPGVAAGGYGIRINNPRELKYRAMWHQEYPAQLRSRDGIVFWSPLLPVTSELGPVRILDKSHREGPIAVYDDDPDNSGRSGAYSLRLHNEAEYLNKYNLLQPLTSPGDLLIMNFDLIHSSGYNLSNRSLWSMQFRYFNFSEKTGKKNNWVGSFSQGIDFRTLHPELFIQPNV